MSEQNVHQTIDDLHSGIAALQLAVDTLGRVADFGGLPGAWSIVALQRISDTLRTGYQRTPDGEEAEQEERENSFLPPREDVGAGQHMCRCGHSAYWHEGPNGTGRCDLVSEERGECECMAFRREAQPLRLADKLDMALGGGRR